MIVLRLAQGKAWSRMTVETLTRQESAHRREVVHLPMERSITASLDEESSVRFASLPIGLSKNKPSVNTASLDSSAETEISEVNAIMV